MAKLDLLRGSIKGRLGQIVGSSSRGTDYIKLYTRPKNPRSDRQVGVRSVFQHVSRIAKAIYRPVLKPYTFPRPVKMSVYNKMMQVNKPLFSENRWLPEKLKIFDGSLFNPGITGAEKQAGSVVIAWDGAEGDAYDIAVGVVHDEVSGKTFCAEEARDTGTVSVALNLPGQTDFSKLHAYLVFVKTPAEGIGEAGEVSDTAYRAVASE